MVILGGWRLRVFEFAGAALWKIRWHTRLIALFNLPACVFGR